MVVVLLPEVPSSLGLGASSVVSPASSRERAEAEAWLSRSIISWVRHELHVRWQLYRKAVPWGPGVLQLIRRQ